MSAPDVDDAALERVLRVVAGADADQVREALARYGTESYEREQRRVQLAILKLVSEDGLDRLEYLVDAAKRDYRDVLAWAEYPRQLKAPIKQSDEESRRLAELDMEQYSLWLMKVVREETSTDDRDP